ncbi:MAG: hypothetical protein PHQ11_17380 [Paludibacter sp.]|nr:hypothetical protein [Paludibacter sp.]
MNKFKILLIIICTLCLSCKEYNKKSKVDVLVATVDSITPSASYLQDKEELQKLIRKVLNWSESDTTFQLLPYLTDSNDSICVGFDLKQLNKNLIILHETGLFSKAFADNYKQIILTLDKKVRNKEFDVWEIGNLPTFRFANDVDPWSLCQDVPYDDPNPWDLVEVRIIKLDKNNCELDWKWGDLDKNRDSGWDGFTYRFKASKENGKWKISYLQGFDYNESIRKDGV